MTDTIGTRWRHELPEASTKLPNLQVKQQISTRIRQAVRDNNVSLLARLQHKHDLRNTDRNRLTSLSWAAMEGNLGVFEWLLLDYGHDDQELSRDGDNNTILHVLASLPIPPSHNPHLLIPPILPTRSKEKVHEIAIRMTDVYLSVFPFLLDWSNSGGKTALHIAAQSGNAAFISLLIDAGADVDLTDLQGNTPLHYASAWGHLDTIRVLLEAECKFAERNIEGFTALDYAFSDKVAQGFHTIVRGVKDVSGTRVHRPSAVTGRSDSGSTNAGNMEMPNTRLMGRVGEGSAGQRLRSGSVSTYGSTGSAIATSSGGYSEGRGVGASSSFSHFQHVVGRDSSSYLSDQGSDRFSNLGNNNNGYQNHPSPVPASQVPERSSSRRHTPPSAVRRLSSQSAIQGGPVRHAAQPPMPPLPAHLASSVQRLPPPSMPTRSPSLPASGNFAPFVLGTPLSGDSGAAPAFLGQASADSDRM